MTCTGRGIIHEGTDGTRPLQRGGRGHVLYGKTVPMYRKGWSVVYCTPALSVRFIYCMVDVLYVVVLYRSLYMHYSNTAASNYARSTSDPNATSTNTAMLLASHQVCVGSKRAPPPSFASRSERREGVAAKGFVNLKTFPAGIRAASLREGVVAKGLSNESQDFSPRESEQPRSFSVRRLRRTRNLDHRLYQSTVSALPKSSRSWTSGRFFASGRFLLLRYGVINMSIARAPLSRGRLHTIDLSRLVGGYGGNNT